MSTVFDNNMTNDLSSKIIRSLADKYDFDSMEAFHYLKEQGIIKQNKKTTTKNTKNTYFKPSIILPFINLKQDNWCNGIKLNHGLYTQCTMKKTKDSIYCKTCLKQSESNATGKPNAGNIDDRINLQDQWRDPKGKAPISFGKYISKNTLDIQEVTKQLIQAYQLPDDYIIPDSILTDNKPEKRGRKPKVNVSDSESETETQTQTQTETKQKKTRGRPRKTVKKIVSNTGDDIISQLVQQAQQQQEQDDITPPSSPISTPKAPKKVKQNKITQKQNDDAKNAGIVASQKIQQQEIQQQEDEQEIVEETQQQEIVEETQDEEIVEETQDEHEDQDQDQDEDEDEETEVQVIKFTIQDKQYLKDQENNIYDIHTQEHIGMWDGQNLVIIDDEE